MKNKKKRNGKANVEDVSHLSKKTHSRTKEPKFAIYGDMGHSKYNPMENLKNACETGKIDFIVHMGDHAYDLGGATDKRGDELSF